MNPLARAVLDSFDRDALEQLAAVLLPHVAHVPVRADGWLDTKACAHHLGVTKHVVYRYVADGMPAHRESENGRLWFRPSEVDQWRLQRCYRVHH
jgi:predicted DNA-binding transcriptional regulator AlpA